ncbi:hypothetical protein [Mucilaginibacter gossypii]|uniref:Uncharacterized protein n=1 Tax=Mucilaginibacter gossypii TaxID=551996 RepID=A0A1G7RJR0_9SPHI|nr:hypothetical protein [Mucilaginibacter gossypii]SDG10972.1 hypothetical protein SAMN05192573_102264 [Mucilaginibacter gossypii]
MESINQIKTRADEIRRKSKKLLAFTVMTVAASALATTVRAQTFAEWFQQKSTQKKYLLQQIAALQVYAAYYKAGNNIAHNGLGSITGSLKTENGLHTTYYNNLNTVSPVVKNNKQVTDILQWQKDILSRMSPLEKTANLNDGERKYIIMVKTALFKDCDQQITELQNVITDSKLKMSDEERLKHIGVIHSAMQNNYRFASAFADQVKVYAVQRAQENNNVISEKKIYGIQ